MTTTARIRIRRDTAAAFTSANPTLALGEIAYETDTFRFKVGTGSTAWTALGYAAQNPTEISGNVPFTSTGAIKIPSGTTAQRPGTPAAGMIRYNSTIGSPEWYSPVDSAWLPFGDDVFEVEYLVVAGGGGASGGAGGAGGYRTNVGGTGLRVRAPQSYTVTVGAGGAGATSAANGTKGDDSVFASITSTGGGYGGGAVGDRSGGSGGSGGGGCHNGGGLTQGGTGNTPATVPAQGNNGAGNGNSGSIAGGSGGGASQAGQAGTSSIGRNGGNGLANTISGSSVTYAGGGGGSHFSVGTFGLGGAGGGGDGNNSAGNGDNGDANTGGGGGGTGGANTGGSGGSGIVIIRYLGAQRATGGTVSAGTGSAAGYTIHTFTTSGTFAIVA